MNPSVLAASDVDTVATWAGLITGIAGIVLSIVAIWFALKTESRNQLVTEQMIKSLQKIESTVERSSNDTQNLVKVAWDRLILGPGLTPQIVRDEPPRDTTLVADGLAAELKADLADERTIVVPAETGTDNDLVEREIQRRVDGILPRLVESLQGQWGPAFTERSSADQMDILLRTIRGLSTQTLEVIRELIQHGHMTRGHYLAAMKVPPLRSSLSQLRETGLLIPLSGKEEGKTEVVYWFPPGLVESLRAALTLLGRHDGEIGRETHRLLKTAKDNSRASLPKGQSAAPA